MELDFGYIVIVIGVILFSMTLHEVMHGFIAYKLGDDTAKMQGRLTLNPLKHIDPFLTLILPVILAIVGGPIFGGAKPVPFNPMMVRGGEWGSALVAIAGPLTNLVLAFIFFGIFHSFGDGASGIVQQILVTAVMVNLGFFIFNMLPIPPLDGSRVIYALAPDFVRRGMEIIERFGIIVVFLIVMLLGPALGQIMVAAITFFLDLFSQAFNF